MRFYPCCMRQILISLTAQPRLLLEGIQICLLSPDELPRSQRLLAAHHYLGALKPVGERRASRAPSAPPAVGPNWARRTAPAATSATSTSAMTNLNDCSAGNWSKTPGAVCRPNTSGLRWLSSKPGLRRGRPRPAPNSNPCASTSSAGPIIGCISATIRHGRRSPWSPAPTWPTPRVEKNLAAFAKPLSPRQRRPLGIRLRHGKKSHPQPAHLLPPLRPSGDARNRTCRAHLPAPSARRLAA